MDLNNLKTSRRDLTEILELLLKIPEKINKIDVDIKKELILEINERQSFITNSIAGLITVNCDYSYPENYLPDRLFEYWAERMSQQFTYYELESFKKIIVQSLQSIENQKEELIMNPFPLIFINGNIYECFKSYQKHIVDFYNDYSYLKKRMEKEKFIHKTTDIEFMDFLLNKLEITPPPKQLEMFRNNDSKLLALSKCGKAIHRVKNFDIVFESCF